MQWKDALLAEFDLEAQTTRKVLERVPDEKLDWQPHQKSMTLRQLASHVAQLPGFATAVVTTDSLDFAQGGFKPFQGSSRQELLAAFDRNAAAARAALAAADEKKWDDSWTLSSGGSTLMTLPRLGMLRSLCFNHLVHHRGQLCVYLRLNDALVPSIYGPSADDDGGFRRAQQ